jgi:uncharacterized protein (DUF1919 family)
LIRNLFHFSLSYSLIKILEEMERRVAFRDEVVLYTTTLNPDGTATIRLGHNHLAETPEQKQKRERREARNRERRLRDRQEGRGNEQ